MPQAAVADGHGVLSRKGEDRADDAGAGEDHLGTRRLQTGDLAPLVRRASSVRLDLSVHLGHVDDRAVDDVRVVAGQAVL